MSATERAYARLVATNPVPDPVQYMASVVDLDAVLRDLEEGIMDTSTREAERTRRNVAPRRRWAVAVAAFIAALTVGGALLVATLTSDTEVADEPSEVEVIDAFFAEWNAGDLEATRAYLDPAVVVPLGVRNLEGWMAWTSQFDGEHAANCAAGSEPGTVVCGWAWITAGTTGAALTATEHTFVVTDAVITRMSLPNYGAFEAPLVRFATFADPDGFQQACGPDGESVMSIGGWALNARCGAFVAQFEAAYVADQSG